MYCNALLKFESDHLKQIPQSQRYKLLGNAVTVDVVKAVVERLELI